MTELAGLVMWLAGAIAGLFLQAFLMDWTCWLLPRWYTVLTLLLPARTRDVRRVELLDHIQSLQEDPSFHRLPPAHLACRLLWGCVCGSVDLLAEAGEEAMLRLASTVCLGWSDLLSLAYEDGDDRRDMTHYIVAEALAQRRSDGKSPSQTATWLFFGLLCTAQSEILMVLKIGLGRAPIYAITTTDQGCIVHGGPKAGGLRRIWLRDP
jgi:hypothetical protein